MFQRIGAVAYKADLNNTIALCDALGNPERQFRSVHVAGTNGKGSSSHLIAAILQSAGYKTGLFTSPHLKDFTERIRVNGVPVGEDFVVDFVEGIRPVLDKLHPSFFEVTVAMAFSYFQHQKVDVAVVEVGLGGRLDSTNVIHPMVSLITNIGYDHMDLLGHTLSKIAFEKAGIIKPAVPVVVSEKQTEVADVFEKKAAEERAPLTFATDQIVVEKVDGKEGTYHVAEKEKRWLPDLVCQLTGKYQVKNLAGVLMTCRLLEQAGWSIPESAIREGISNVVSLTGLKGRWQRLGDSPLVICDTGHNEDGIREVVGQINDTPHDRLHLVIGMVRDKDISNMLSLLPREANYYFCEAKIPRAMPAGDLSALAQSKGLKGIVVKDVNDAIRQAKSGASAGDLIFVGGSTFVVAEIDNL